MMSKLQGYLSITLLLEILLSKCNNGGITPIPKNPERKF